MYTCVYYNHCKKWEREAPTDQAICQGHTVDKVIEQGMNVGPPDFKFQVSSYHATLPFSHVSSQGLESLNSNNVTKVLFA